MLNVRDCWRDLGESTAFRASPLVYADNLVHEPKIAVNELTCRCSSLSVLALPMNLICSVEAAREFTIDDQRDLLNVTGYRSNMRACTRAAEATAMPAVKQTKACKFRTICVCQTVLKMAKFCIEDRTLLTERLPQK